MSYDDFDEIMYDIYIEGAQDVKDEMPDEDHTMDDESWDV